MDGLDAGPPGPRVFTVSELAAGVRELLEDGIGRVWVVGEISNLHRARSGHCYFTLKDDGAQIRAALFRGDAARIPFDPEEGLEVVVGGAITLYAARGDLQVIVRSLEPRGRGALQLAVEQLRGRLEAEGLFDAAAKRALPAWPRRIGLVTSPTGAAVRDVLEVTGARMPSIPILLAPTRVQGDGAEIEIEAALRAVAGADEVDAVLLVRGGGSLEDLMAFNSERVARAVRACPVPVVCGVGHETDVSIADLAADRRAPTPSAAAAAVTPDRALLTRSLARDAGRLASAAARPLAGARQRLDGTSARLHGQSPARRLAERRERLGRAREGLGRAGRRPPAAARERLGRAAARLARAAAAARGAARGRLEVPARGLARVAPGLAAGPRARLAAAGARLDALSPLGVLARGYAIARREVDGRIVRDPDDAAPGDRLRVRTARAEIGARVESVRAADPERGPEAASGAAGDTRRDPGTEASADAPTDPGRDPRISPKSPI